MESTPDGGNWLLMRPDGVLEQDVRIIFKNRRWRSYLPSIRANIISGAPVFETGAERYAWLNKILAVGVGERLPPNIARYSIFEIL